VIELVAVSYFSAVFGLVRVIIIIKGLAHTNTPRLFNEFILRLFQDIDIPVLAFDLATDTTTVSANDYNRSNFVYRFSHVAKDFELILIDNKWYLFIHGGLIGGKS
jgi:hypothetical protein